METKSSILSLLAMLQLFVLLTLSSASYNDFLGEPSILYSHNRTAEIEKYCSLFLSSASKLSPDDNRSYRLKKELSFDYGDWDQESGGSLFMPFDESDLPWSRLHHTVPLKLVSFQVMDISSVHHFENSVSLGGILSIGISRNTSMFPKLQSPSFFSSPGLSILTIAFEGVYLESEENGGERLLCLLGNTSLPISDYSNLLDDQILLVLRYPQIFNLTRRAITGELRSLKEQGSLGYFDVVYIFSQLNSHTSKYQSSNELKSRACDLHVYQEELREDGVNTLSGSEFCHFLQEASQEPFSVFPNYKFEDKHAHQRKLGPFEPGKEISFAQSSLKHEDFRLVWQDLVCQEEISNDNINSTKISAVLRVFSTSIPEYTARQRTGLSSLTLSAEGTWDSSSGQLCMIGCLGAVDSGLEGCNSQISLYIPRVFSIRQRSTILGSISSTTNETDPFFPLLFDSARSPKVVYPNLGLHITSHLYYKYSKIERATSIRKKNQPAKAFSLLKHLLMKYPALKDGHDRLNLLLSDLNVFAYANCRQSSDSRNLRIYIRMEALTLGPLLGHLEPIGIEKQKLTKSQLLNISVNLMFTESPSVFTTSFYRDLSPLFLEGVYDPLAGDMHLIGCRKVADGGISVERGLDCLVQAKVQYPSQRGRWLKNSSVEITIISQRSEDDALYFNPINLQTDMIPYEKHQDDVAFRKLFEGVLRILISLVAVGIITSQLLYMNKNGDCIPYVSLFMLAEQILGYSAELVRTTGLLFKSKEFAFYDKLPYDLQEHQLLMKALEIPARLLVLAALMLTVRLYQKALEAKSRPNAYGSNKPKRIPQNKHVFQRSLRFYIAMGLILVVLQVIDLFLRNDLHLMDALVLPGLFMRQVELLVLWCQNLFLYPQILENSLWKNQVKPLRRTYYVGLTLLRMILYFYNFIIDYDFNQVSSDFFSISGIIAVPVIMIAFSTVVHIQQSWNYLKPGNH